MNQEAANTKLKEDMLSAEIMTKIPVIELHKLITHRRLLALNFRFSENEKDKDMILENYLRTNELIKTLLAL